MEVEPTEVNSNDSMTPKNGENSAAFVSMSDRLARGEVYADQFGKAINEGLQIDEQDLTDGSTLLMKAVSQQPYRFNSVSTLITIGADVNLLNAKGENAFMVLVRNPNPGIGYQHSVKQLIRSRANIYQVDNAGRSGLDDIADLSFKTEIEALYNTTNIAN